MARTFVLGGAQHLVSSASSTRLLISSPGGAIGSVIAHQLRAAGREMTLLMRKPTVSRASITLEEPKTGGPTTVQHFDVEQSGGEGRPIQQLIVATKAFDLAPALLALRPRLSADSGVVLVHNGLITEPLEDYLPGVSPQNVFTGIWMGGSTLRKTLPEAMTRWTSPSEWIIGPTALPNASTPPVSASTRELLDAILACKPLLAREVDSRMIRRTQRVKLSTNCILNGLTGLYNVANGEFAGIPAFANIVKRLCEETAAVYEAERRALNEPAEPELTAASLLAANNRLMHITASNYSSTLQDLRRGKQTELSHLNGAIVALGRRYGVATPTHTMLWELVELRSALGSGSFVF